MAQTKAPTLTDFVHDPDCEGRACECAVREIGWISHEVAALMIDNVPNDSPRWMECVARKRALLAYVESTR